MITRDPLDGIDGTTTVANPYHYADNDPLNKTDPLGLRTTDPDINSGGGSGSPSTLPGCLVNPLSCVLQQLVPPTATPGVAPQVSLGDPTPVPAECPAGQAPQSTPGNPSTHVSANGPQCQPAAVNGLPIEAGNIVAGAMAAGASLTECSAAGAPRVHLGRYATLNVQQNPVTRSIQWGMKLHPFFLTSPQVTVSAFIVVNGATHTYAPHPEPPTYQFHGSYQAMPPAAVVVFMFSIKPVVPVMGPQGPGNFFFQWWSCKGL